MIPSSDIDPGTLQDLKRRYGTILRMPLRDGSIYLRTITRQEAASIGLTEGVMDADHEDKVFSTAIVWPLGISDDDSLPAGIASRACTSVLQASGLNGVTGLSKALEKARSRHTVYHSIAATVCAAFPRVLPADLDEAPIDKLMDLLVIAEEVLQTQMLVSVGAYSEISFEESTKTQEKHTQSAKNKDDKLRQQMMTTSFGEGGSSEEDEGDRRPS